MQNNNNTYLKNIDEYDDICIRCCFFGSTKLYKYLYDSVILKIEVNSPEEKARFKYSDGQLCIIFPEELYKQKSLEDVAKCVAMMVSHLFLRHGTRIKMFKNSVTYDETLIDVYDKILDYWTAKFINSMVPRLIDIPYKGGSYSNLEIMLKNADKLINARLDIEHTDDDHSWIWDEDIAQEMFFDAEQESANSGQNGDGQSGDDQADSQDSEEQQDEREEGQGDDQQESEENTNGDDQREGMNQLGDLEDMLQEGYLSMNLTSEELKDLQDKFEKDGKMAGSQAGNMVKEMMQKKVRKKIKWEKVVKFTVRADDEDIELDAWNKEDRRLLFMSKDIMMPGREYDYKKTRIPIFLFMDTSGSCVHYADRFWRAAHTMDPKKFDIRLFCFDTRTYETTLKSKQLYGFGGTRFDIIEERIQETMKTEDIKYPKAVFVITDGYGNRVIPEKPERWHVFYTDDTMYDRCFPSQCKSYKLSDFE